MVQIDNLINKRISGYQVTKILKHYPTWTLYEIVELSTGNKKVLGQFSFLNNEEYQKLLKFNNKEKTDLIIERQLKKVSEEIKTFSQLSSKLFENTLNIETILNSKNKQENEYELFLIMDYGIPLKSYIDKNPFSVDEVIRTGLEITNILENFHKSGVTLGNLKLDSIFIDNNHKIKVLNPYIDFILNRVSTNGDEIIYISSYLTETKSNNLISHDIYSLGIILYELLNYKRKPFLPAFPSNYSKEDINSSLNKLHRGYALFRPANGGEKLGSLIVKAIQDSNQFDSVNSFHSELIETRNSLFPETLNSDISMRLTNKPKDKPINKTTYNTLSINKSSSQTSNVSKSYYGSNNPVFNNTKTNSNSNSSKTVSNNYNQNNTSSVNLTANSQPTPKKSYFGRVIISLFIIIIGIILALGLNNYYRTSDYSYSDYYDDSYSYNSDSDSYSSVPTDYGSVDLMSYIGRSLEELEADTGLHVEHFEDNYYFNEDSSVMISLSSINQIISIDIYDNSPYNLGGIKYGMSYGEALSLYNNLVLYSDRVENSTPQELQGDLVSNSDIYIDIYFNDNGLVDSVGLTNIELFIDNF